MSKDVATLPIYTAIHPSVVATRIAILSWPVKCYSCGTVNRCGVLVLHGEVSELEPILAEDSPDWVLELSDSDYERWCDSLNGHDWSGGEWGLDFPLCILSNVVWADTRALMALRANGFNWGYRVYGQENSEKESMAESEVFLVNKCSCGGDLGMFEAFLGHASDDNVQLIEIQDANPSPYEFRGGSSVLCG